MVMAHIDCQIFFNHLVDMPGQRMAFKAFAGIPAEAPEKIHKLVFGVAACGCAARVGQCIIAKHAYNSDDGL